MIVEFEHDSALAPSQRADPYTATVRELQVPGELDRIDGARHGEHDNARDTIATEY
jgi:hypothetical protein